MYLCREQIKQSVMKELFKSVNQQLFKSIKGINWFDKEGIMNINENLYISFKLDDVGTSNNFNGVHVDVYSKQTGILKKKFFRFSDYLNINHLWYIDSELDWYTVVKNEKVNNPTTLEMAGFCKHIQTYIKAVLSN